MPAIRFSGRRGIYGEECSGGDTVMLGEFVSKLTTVGAAPIPAPLMLTGVLYRSGSTAAYTDTLDSAANILTALAGNSNAGAVVVGSSFRWRLINSVAFAQTLTLGTGLVQGVGSLVDAASTWNDYLLTFLSLQQPTAVVVTTVNGSNQLLWNLLPNQQAIPEGVNPISLNIQPGASVSGAGIPAGSTVTGIIQGQGGTLGVTISANATATNAVGVLATFSPTIQIDDIGSGTL